MKRILIIALTLITIVNAQSQAVLNKKVSFKSERLPLMPIANLGGYFFTVETPYPENNNAVIEMAKKKHERALANHPNEVVKAEKNHERALIQYVKDVITAQENFKMEAEAYDQMSAVEKISLQEKKLFSNLQENLALKNQKNQNTKNLHLLVSHLIQTS